MFANPSRITEMLLSGRLGVPGAQSRGLPGNQVSSPQGFGGDPNLMARLMKMWQLYGMNPSSSPINNQARQEPAQQDPMAYLRALWSRYQAKPGKGLIGTM